MPERIGFLIHKTARENIKRKTVDLAESTENSYIKELRFPLSEIEKDTNIVVVVGGDGSVRRVSEALIGKENPILLVAPGGSQNGFYRALLDTRTVITSDQLTQQSIEKIPSFRPGIINGRLFNHQSAVGELALIQSEFNHRLRAHQFPRNYRTYAASALTIARGLTLKEESDYLVRLAATNPYAAALKILPEQDLFSDTLSLISIKSAKTRIQSVAKLGFIFFCALIGGKPPLLDIQSDRIFNFSEEIKKANNDGEVLDLNEDKTIRIERSKQSIRVAALEMTPLH